MANTTKANKVTEEKVLTTVKAMVLNEELPYEDVCVEDVVEYVERKLAQKAAKAEKMKEARAQKAAEGDALTAAVREALTAEFQTCQAVTDAVDFEGATKSKVQYRLTQLVKAGEAVKDLQKIGDSKLTVYALA